MTRRTIPEGPGLRVPVQTRTTQELRDRLGAAAERSGRSIAQEVEIRLERSFEFIDLIDKTINSCVDSSLKHVKQLLDMQESNARLREEHLISFGGGDNLFLFWSRLASAIEDTERETGKSIREDQATREAAERAVLGAIPSLFRRLPEPYSVFRERVKAQPVEDGALSRISLASLARRAERSDDDAL